MNEEIIIPLAGIIFSFSTPMVIIGIIVYLDYRKKERMFSTIDKALEKGVEVPESVLKAIEKPASRGSSLQRGLLWCGAGIGVLLAWSIFRNFNEASLGFIPLFIGIAYLINSRLEPAHPDT